MPLRRMSLPVKKNEPLDPTDVRLFCADTVMVQPDGFPQLTKQLGFFLAEFFLGPIPI